MDFCNLKEVLHIGCPRVVASDTMGMDVDDLHENIIS